MKKKAVWNGEVIAESDDLVNVEGNYYFPADAIKKDYLRQSDTETQCFWKGTASYYSLEVNGETNRDAAWYYADPAEAAKGIKDRVAFWRGVQVVDA